MFNPFSKKPKSGDVVTLKINGMHCSSCSMNIDGALEGLPGVIESSTNYARSISTVRFDPEKVDIFQLKKVVKELGYEMQES